MYTNIDDIVISKERQKPVQNITARLSTELSTELREDIEKNVTPWPLSQENISKELRLFL